MIDIKMPYYRFGSKDSRDIDILIDHFDCKGEESDKDLIESLKKLHPEIEKEKWQINIIKIEDAFVIKSIPSKGSADSVNNSLFETYHLHKQNHPFPLKGLVERCRILALVKCLRAVLTSFAKYSAPTYYETTIRPIIKSKLFKDWIDLLDKIDFNELQFDNDVIKKNQLKSLAFHIGQTISLINNIEIYTKQELVYWHPELSNLIKREECENSIALTHGKLKELQQLINTLELKYSAEIVMFESSKVNFKKERLL